MQKIPCSVIRDLLVLYDDDVCSEETKQIIEEHIKECEECRAIYEKTVQKLPKISPEMELVKDVVDGFKEDKERMKGEIKAQGKMLEKTFKKMKWKLTARTLIVSGIVVVILLTGYTFWQEVIEERIDRVDYEDVKITEMYELSNGDIYCTFKTKDKFLYMQNDCIQVPEGEGWKNYEDGWQQLYFQYPHFYDRSLDVEFLARDTVSLVFPRTEKIQQYSENESVTHEMKKIYYNQKGEADAVVIWEEGQDIPKAPEELEKKVQKVIEEQRGNDIDEWIQFGSYPIEIE